MRRAGLEEDLRVRGVCFEIQGSRERFRALLQPIDPSQGLDKDSAEGQRVVVPVDLIPACGIKVGTVFRSEDGRLFRVQSFAPSESVIVRSFNCDVTAGGEGFQP